MCFKVFLEQGFRCNIVVVQEKYNIAPGSEQPVIFTAR